MSDNKIKTPKEFDDEFYTKDIHLTEYELAKRYAEYYHKYKVKEELIKFSDKLLADFEIWNHDRFLKWELAGTDQRYNSEEIVEFLTNKTQNNG